MADPESAPWREQPAADAVAGCVGDRIWAVQGGRWDGLPAHVADLVAPPVVVTASAPVLATASAAQTVVTPAAGPDLLSHRDRRLALLLFGADRPMVAPAPPRAGRHRRPAWAS